MGERLFWGQKFSRKQVKKSSQRFALDFTKDNQGRLETFDTRKNVNLSCCCSKKQNRQYQGVRFVWNKKNYTKLQDVYMWAHLWLKNKPSQFQIQISNDKTSWSKAHEFELTCFYIHQINTSTKTKLWLQVFLATAKKIDVNRFG